MPGWAYNSFVTTTTILNRSDTHSKGLKSTVPNSIVKMLGLEKGSLLDWDVATIVNGKIVENVKTGGKSKKNNEPENVIIVRVTQEE